mmetsp:Transcript_27393/g.45827  ORF Transcript_27393/g.45827 Transcript_27393/m.45827 type:complete len:214 (-) Transcript_27393:21-662(-)
MPMSTMSSISTSAKSSISSTPSCWKPSMKKPSRSAFSHWNVPIGLVSSFTRSRSLWNRCNSSTCTAATVKRRRCRVGRPIMLRSSSATSGKSSTLSTPSSSNSSTKFSQRMSASHLAGVRLSTSSPRSAATALLVSSSSGMALTPPCMAAVSKVGCASTATAARKRRRCSGDMAISMRSRSSTSAKSTTRSTPSFIRAASNRFSLRGTMHTST